MKTLEEGKRSQDWLTKYCKSNNSTEKQFTKSMQCKSKTP